MLLEVPEDAQQDAFKDVSALVRWLARDLASGGVDVGKSAPAETESE